MKQFLDGTDAAFDELERRARHACIRFRGQPMPPGCMPPEADIGFEIDAANGSASLFVEREVHYGGQDPLVQEWLHEGVLVFRSFPELTDWIRGPLRRAFLGGLLSSRDQGSEVTRLTDVAAMHEGIREVHQAVHLDEKRLSDALRRHVLGQEHAVGILASVMASHFARVRPARPAVAFAVGPSGVGKTRTAEMLAQALRDFGISYHFLRLDMSEYQEQHRVSQLLGAPQGYIGYGQGSQLLDTLRANPRTIVLFDEIEKAHPAILRALMNCMDAGRLSAAAQASEGREVDCRQAVLAFTSNVAAAEILDEIESRDAFGNRRVEDEVCRRRLHAAGIAPEIVGRIGHFLVFRPLSDETRAEIAALAITEIAGEYGLNVSYVEPSVIIDLMQNAGSQSFGARPANFLIDEALGRVFASAAREGLRGRVKVEGPPFRCTPLAGNDAGPRAVVDGLDQVLVAEP